MSEIKGYRGEKFYQLLESKVITVEAQVEKDLKPRMLKYEETISEIRNLFIQSISNITNAHEKTNSDIKILDVKVQGIKDTIEALNIMELGFNQHTLNVIATLVSILGFVVVLILWISGRIK